jgi:excisionase family DNA binding protein
MHSDAGLFQKSEMADPDSLGKLAKRRETLMTATNAMVIAILLRPEEAGRILGFSRSKIYQLLASGELPSIRAGKSVRVPRLALEKWIEANTTGGELRSA